jgi:hypothetical protein
MRDSNEEPRQVPEKRTKGPLDGYPSGMGSDVAILLILGTSLALASAAWFVVGLLMNTQLPGPPPREGIKPPVLLREAVPMSYLKPLGGSLRIAVPTFPI